MVLRNHKQFFMTRLWQWIKKPSRCVITKLDIEITNCPTILILRFTNLIFYDILLHVFCCKFFLNFYHGDKYSSRNIPMLSFSLVNSNCNFCRQRLGDTKPRQKMLRNFWGLKYLHMISKPRNSTRPRKSLRKQRKKYQVGR